MEQGEGWIGWSVGGNVKWESRGVRGKVRKTVTEVVRDESEREGHLGERNEK